MQCCPSLTHTWFQGFTSLGFTELLQNHILCSADGAVRAELPLNSLPTTSHQPNRRKKRSPNVYKSLWMGKVLHGINTFISHQAARPTDSQ